MMKRSLWWLCCALALGASTAQAQTGPEAGDDDRREVRRQVIIETDDAEDDDLFAWFDDDEMAVGESAGGGEVRRHVIRTRGTPGMGRMQGGRGMHGRGGMHAGAMARLDLSEEQRTRMRELHVAHRRKSIQSRAELQLARLDLHQLMQQDKPQKAAIDAQIDRIARLQADRRKAGVATMLEARALLTPEQRKQLREGRGGPGGGKPGARRPMGGRGGHGAPGDTH